MPAVAARLAGVWPSSGRNLHCLHGPGHRSGPPRTDWTFKLIAPTVPSGVLLGSLARQYGDEPAPAHTGTAGEVQVEVECQRHGERMLKEGFKLVL